MQRRQLLKTSSTAGLAALITPMGTVEFSNRQAPPQSLVASFQNPSHSARPQTWWHWMNGKVTREGITLDLEAPEAGVRYFSGTATYRRSFLIPATYLSANNRLFLDLGSAF